MGLVPALGVAAYDDGLSLESGVVVLLHGGEEGVHVDVKDIPFSHGSLYGGRHRERRTRDPYGIGSSIFAIKSSTDMRIYPS